MKGVCLTFYTHEFEKHEGRLLYEWLLEFARAQGLSGGSAFRGLAGFGHRGHFHEEHFFELASDVPVEVRFLLSQGEVLHFLESIKKEKIDLLYSEAPIQYHRHRPSSE